MSAFSQGALIQTNTAITSGTLTLGPTSSPLIVKTGASSAIVVLPTASSTLRISRSFTVFNEGTSVVSVLYADSTQAGVVAPNYIKTFSLWDNTTTNGSWHQQSIGYVDAPLTVRQASPSPDATVVITATPQLDSDGAGKNFSVFGSLSTTYAQTSINMQTGSVSGGTVTNEGLSFSLPATTTGFFRRMAMVYKASSNTVDVKFSSPVGSIASLPEPSTLFSSMVGAPIGMVDLVAISSGGFKTAGSTTSIIENVVGSTPRIYRFRDISEVIAASSRTYVDTALTTLGTTSGTLLNTVLADIDGEINQPLRLAASTIPDSFLRIQKAILTSSDGGGRAAPAFNDIVGNYPETTINFATGAVSGGTVTKDGLTFSLPTTTIGNYRRVAFVYKPDTEVIDCTFSTEAASYGALTNAGTLFSLLDGLPIGYVDLQAYAATSFKSPNAGTNVIANTVAGIPAIYRFGSGSGAGGAGDKSFNISNIATPTVYLKGGSLLLTDGRKLATYSGSGSSSTSFFKDITANLTTIYGAAPANSTTYWIYIDLSTLSGSTTLSDTGEVIYGVTQSNLVVSTANPSLKDATRYVSIGSLKSASFGNAWSGTGASKSNQTKFRPNTQPTTVNPTVYRLSQAIGSVGTVGQCAAGHILATSSFPSSLGASSFSYYNLASTVNDNSGNARNLTASGAVVFTGTNILGSINSAATFSGAQYAQSNDSFFNVGVDFTSGGWFYHSTWSTATSETLLSKYDTSNGTGGFEIVLEDIGGQDFVSFKFGPALAYTASVPSSGMGAATWHHLAIMFDSTALEIRAYIDGSLAATAAVILGAYANPAAVPFAVAARKSAGVGASFFTGRAEEVFFINTNIADVSLRKIYSYKLTHSSSISSKNQEWFGTFTDSVATQENVSWLVDKSDSNILYMDLNSFSATTTADLALRNNGYSGIVVSPTIFDTGYFSSALASPQNHYLPDVPNNIIFLYEVSPGEFEVKLIQGLISANSTTLSWDLSAYTFSATQRGRIIASVGQSTAGIPKATTGQLGVIKLNYTGFNKVVGTNEEYTTLSNANLQAGDSVIVLDSYATTSESISVSDISITFMPGASITSTSASPALTLSGNRINLYNANYNFTASAPGSAISISGNDNYISNLKLAGAAGTISSGILVQAGALRNFVTASVRSTGATITITLTDNGTDTDASVRG